MSDAPEQQEEDKGTDVRRWTIGVIVLVAVAFLIVFAVQNTEEAEVEWIFGSTSGPLVFVILASALAGFIVGALGILALQFRRRHRDD